MNLRDLLTNTAYVADPSVPDNFDVTRITGVLPPDGPGSPSDDYIRWRDRFLGSAFFVSRQADQSIERVIIYAVTARHVIDGFASSRMVQLRFTASDGNSYTVDSNKTDWKSPDDKAVDVAVLPIVHNRGEAFISSFPVDRFVSAEMIATEKVGVGDEVFIIGLFEFVPGISRNAPVLFKGTLAATPNDPVLTCFQTGSIAGIEAYLLQAPHQAGMSGAAIYVHTMVEPSQVGSRGMATSSKIYLLGLFQGHIGPHFTKGWIPGLPKEPGKEVFLHPLGLCLGIPAALIAETIELSEVQSSVQTMDPVHFISRQALL